MSLKLFHSTACLTFDAPAIATEELKSFGFRVKGGFGSPTESMRRFIAYNAECLDFLGVQALIEGVDPRPSLHLRTGQYIGAIPLRRPDSGNQGGDLLVYPRFGKRGEAFPKLTKLLSLLEEVIHPEYLPSLPLASGAMVRPPLYYDALKYVDLFEEATRQSWRKFRVECGLFPYPKANTQWDAYARRSANPENALSYPVKGSVLSGDHPEWQMLKHVLLLAIRELSKSTTPQEIRLPSLRKADSLLQVTREIQPRATSDIPLHFTDPKDIKSLKAQASLLLRQEGSAMSAWRMDIAELFERYVQFVLAKTVAELPARLYKNPHFVSHSAIPAWGLRQLEPDALLMIGDTMVAVDAKYKAHYYGQGVTSDTLRETHRADLHQILAYCSFADSFDKLGMLIYPADAYSQRRLVYRNPYLGNSNTIWLIGLPFDADTYLSSKEALRKLLSELLLPAA
ncbi:MAG: hypothetical protein AB9880_09170 [Christensenellales bacterium]